MLTAAHGSVTAASMIGMPPAAIFSITNPPWKNQTSKYQYQHNNSNEAAEAPAVQECLHIAAQHANVENFRNNCLLTAAQVQTAAHASCAERLHSQQWHGQHFDTAQHISGVALLQCNMLRAVMLCLTATVMFHAVTESYDALSQVHLLGMATLLPSRLS